MTGAHVQEEVRKDEQITMYMPCGAQLHHAYSLVSTKAAGKDHLAGFPYPARMQQHRDSMLNTMFCIAGISSLVCWPSHILLGLDVAVLVLLPKEVVSANRSSSQSSNLERFPQCACSELALDDYHIMPSQLNMLATN